MKATFSELQFAYGVTRELENGVLGLGIGTPYFPSLQVEGDLGFDVAFTNGMIPIFFQYKVPEKLTTDKSKEWRYYNEEYFRFRIYPDSKSNQHNQLKNLSDIGYLTYYCSPGFSEWSEYKKHHSRGSIVANSIFVPLSDLIRISGSDNHVITYNKDLEYIMFSEPQYGEGTYNYNRLLSNLKKSEISIKSFSELYSFVLRVAKELDIPNLVDEQTNTISELSMVKRIRQITISIKAMMGIELMLISFSN